MKNYLVFTVNHPIAKLFNVYEGEEERDRIIAQYKATYPSISVYWPEVQEGAVVEVSK